MVTSRGTVWMVVLAAGLAMLGSACMAADGLPAVGIVDVAKVNNEAPRIKQLSELLEKKGVEFDSKLGIRGQSLMLPEEQIRELIDLKLKPAPTDADKARIKQITDQEKANDDELKKLQTTPQLTDDQKKRMGELADFQKKAQEMRENMAKDYTIQYQSEAANLTAKANAEIEEVVKKLATDKKLAFVFAKNAIFFGGTDITSEVISKLDRKPE